MRGKLPDMTINQVPDMAVRDRDAEQKGQAKMYADARRGAQYSNVNVGDNVLVRQDKINKLTTTFGATPFTVVNKTGNSLVVESPEGVQYSRNTIQSRRVETSWKQHATTVRAVKSKSLRRPRMSTHLTQ